MFRKVNPNILKSDEGFSVEILIGYDGGLIYCEGSKRMLLGSTVIVKPPGMMIYPHDIRSWEPPFDDENVDEVKRDQIIGRIHSAFKFWGLRLLVHEDDLSYKSPWTEEDLDYFRKKGFKVYKYGDKED